MMFGFLPEQYRAYAYIAGGWAACPSLATDMDVWVVVPGANLALLKEELLAHLVGRVSVEVLGDQPTHAEYANTLKVAILKTGGRKDVHLLVSDAQIIEQVIEEFDISTHALAIGPVGDIHKATFWTSIREQPIVNKMTPTTPERLVKIKTRYGL